MGRLDPAAHAESVSDALTSVSRGSNTSHDFDQPHYNDSKLVLVTQRTREIKPEAQTGKKQICFLKSRWKQNENIFVSEQILSYHFSLKLTMRLVLDTLVLMLEKLDSIELDGIGSLENTQSKLSCKLENFLQIKSYL